MKFTAIYVAAMMQVAFVKADCKYEFESCMSDSECCQIEGFSTVCIRDMCTKYSIPQEDDIEDCKFEYQSCVTDGDCCEVEGYNSYCIRAQCTKTPAEDYTSEFLTQ